MSRRLLLALAMLSAVNARAADGVALPDDANALAAVGAGAQPPLVFWCTEHQRITQCAVASDDGRLVQRLFDIAPDREVEALHHGRSGDLAELSPNELLAVVATRRASHGEPLELLA